MNITQKKNIESMNGYTETDFGCYTFDLERPTHYEANSLYISKITKDLVSTLNDKKFQKVYATKNIFDQICVDYNKVELFEMVKIKKIDDLEINNAYKIELLNKDSLKDYSKYEEKVQLKEYSYYYNKVDESFLEKTIYIIKDNDKIIGNFEILNDTVIENVYLLPQYRNKGIMKYFINLKTDVNFSLICEEEVINFYEKCGFKMNEKIVNYTIDYSEKIKDAVIRYVKNKEMI